MCGRPSLVLYVQPKPQAGNEDEQADTQEGQRGFAFGFCQRDLFPAVRTGDGLACARFGELKMAPATRATTTDVALRFHAPMKVKTGPLRKSETALYLREVVSVAGRPFRPLNSISDSSHSSSRSDFHFGSTPSSPLRISTSDS